MCAFARVCVPSALCVCARLRFRVRGLHISARRCLREVQSMRLEHVGCMHEHVRHGRAARRCVVLCIKRDRHMHGRAYALAAVVHLLARVGLRALCVHDTRAPNMHTHIPVQPALAHMRAHPTSTIAHHT